MPRPKVRKATKHVRCGTPDCDWGTPLLDLTGGQLDRCRREFRRHCIERHGLDPADTERQCWFDLQAFTLTLLDE